MKAKTGDPKLDQALGKLARALRNLDGTEGRPIARRNARRRVLTAARALRGQVDQRWPAIVQRAGGPRLKTFEARAARLTRAGWEKISDSDEIAAYAAAGVPVRHVRGPSRQTDSKGQPLPQAAYYVPGWAVDIGTGNPARLRAAKKSTNERKIARAEAALKN